MPHEVGECYDCFLCEGEEPEIQRLSDWLKVTRLKPGARLRQPTSTPTSFATAPYTAPQRVGSDSPPVPPTPSVRRLHFGVVSLAIQNPQTLRIRLTQLTYKKVVTTFYFMTSFILSHSIIQVTIICSKILKEVLIFWGSCVKNILKWRFFPDPLYSSTWHKRWK